MVKSDFKLNIKLAGPMQECPCPKEVSLDIAGYELAVAVGDKVLAGTLVARSRTPGTGDLHTPVAGTVTEVAGLSEFSLLIEAQGTETVEPRDLLNLAGAELKTALAELGIDTTRLNSAKTLIINAMPPEPGILVNEQLLRDYRAVVAKGLDMAKRVVSASQVVLAGIGVDASAFGTCSVKHLPATYPSGLDPLVIKTITGREDAQGVSILSVLELFALGQVADSGLPFTKTVLTVNGRNYLACIGTPLKDLLNLASITARERDRVILGGPMRGEAAISLDAGITKNSWALLVIPHGTYPPVEDNSCLNCGQCVLICPSRVLPNMISRAAEFGLFERAREYGVDACMECGLCGYHCTGRRPILQYIRLAKKELADADLAARKLEMADAPE